MNDNHQCQCQHPGCQNEGQRCTVYGLEFYYCDSHMTEHGFCWSCCTFTERFFGGWLCENCRDELEAALGVPDYDEFFDMLDDDELDMFGADRD